MHTSPGLPRAGRTRLELLQDQLEGMRAWHAELRVQLAQDTDTLAATREARMDARRRLDALKRAQQALLKRADDTVRMTQDVLTGRSTEALLVHRNPWMRDKLEAGLRESGLAVVVQCDDGADGLGTAIAQQPDLLLVEDRLPSLTGLELVRSARVFLPHTTIAAQVEDERSVADLLDAGASAVFTRRVPPAVLAEQVAAYLGSRPEQPLLLL
ncbi:MAG: Response regulator receiver domain [Frankiales bacterium]|nr:Response regulator receiver domain [Frankiales bacterium]